MIQCSWQNTALFSAHYSDVYKRQPYEKIGYARPVVLDSNGAWEAVLENAYDIIVTSEINGEDIA